MPSSILKRSAAWFFAGVFAVAGCKGDRGPAGPAGPGSGGGVLGAGLQVGIVSATAPASGPPTVTFTVKDAAGAPIDFLAELQAGAFGATRGPRFSIAQASAAGGTYDQALYETATAGAPSGKQTRPTSVPASIALADAAALYKANADGSYTFTFPTAAPALPALASGFPIAPVQSAQTLVGIHAARTFDGIQYPAGASFEFVPAGGTATPRKVVTDDACNQCHKHLTAHGTRRTVGLCLTCHTPGWVQNPGSNNTANAIDFRVMIHQIHRGQQPTDVQNTNPWVYKWSSTNDFSSVAFAPPNTVRNCVFCHQGGAQSDNWKTKPSRAACGACHYAIDFTTGAGHAGGAAADDSLCAQCHQPDTDGVAPSITKVHSFLYDALTNTTFKGVDLGVVIDSVDVRTPTAGTVTFTVTRDGAPADIKASPLDNLRFTIAGPTTDYGGPNGPVPAAGTPPHTVGYIQTGNFNGTAASAPLLAALTPTGTPGQYTAPLATMRGTPAALTNIDLTNANGQTVGVGVEAYVIEEGTCPSPPCAEREWAQRPLPPTATSPTGVLYARVGGGTATPRRLITDAKKCNVCHEDLGFHGGESRKGPDYCAMCHNSQNVNDERTSQLEVAPGGGAFSKTPGTVQLSVMIHRIHRGTEAVPVGSPPTPRPPFTLGATRDFRADPDADPPRAEGEAPPAVFGHQFPGDLKDCQTCHLPGGYGLPEANVLPTRIVTFTCKEAPGADANSVCGTLNATNGQVVAPDTAAGDEFWTKSPDTLVGAGQAHCGSCHDSPAAGAHISQNTIGGVESCEVCHGDGRFMDPIEIHQGRP